MSEKKRYRADELEFSGKREAPLPPGYVLEQPDEFAQFGGRQLTASELEFTNDPPPPPGFVLDPQPDEFAQFGGRQIVDEPLPPGFVLDQPPQLDAAEQGVLRRLLSRPVPPQVRAAADWALRNLTPAGQAATAFEKAGELGKAAAPYLEAAAQGVTDLGARIAGEPGRYLGAAVGTPVAVAAEMLPKSQLQAMALPAADLAGGAAVAGLNRLSGGRLSAAAARLVEVARKYDVDLSPADISKSKLVSLIESALEKMPASSGKIEEFRQRQIAAVRALKDRIAAKAGPTAADEAGGIVQDAIEANSKAFYQKSQKLYETLESAVNPSDRIPTDVLKAAAKRLAEKQKNLAPSLRDSKLNGVLADLLGKPRHHGPEPEGFFVKLPSGETLGMGANQKGATFQQLKSLREALNDLAAKEDAAFAAGRPGQKFQGSQAGGAYKLLRKAIDEDLDAYAKETGGKLKEAYDTARAFYAEGKQLFGSRAIRRVTQAYPERVAEMVIRPGNVTEIELVKKAAGEDAFAKIKGQFTKRLLDKAFEVDEATGLQKFAPARFASELARYGDDTLAKVFKPGELEQIRELSLLANAVGTAEKMAGNPSGTGRAVAAIGSVVGLGFRPVEWVATQFGTRALAELYLHPFGRKFLIEGLKVEPGTKAAARNLTRLAAFLKAKGYSQRKEKKP